MTAHRLGYRISPLVCFLLQHLSVAVTAPTTELPIRSTGGVWAASQWTNASDNSTGEPATEFLLTATSIQVHSNATTNVEQWTNTTQVFSDTTNDWTQSTLDPINGLTESTSDSTNDWSQSNAASTNDWTQSTFDPINGLAESTSDPTNDWSQNNASYTNDWTQSTPDHTNDLTESTSDPTNNRAESTTTIGISSDPSATSQSPSSTRFVEPDSSSDATGLCSEQQQQLCVDGICAPECSTQSGVSHSGQTGTGAFNLENTGRDTTIISHQTYVTQTPSTDMPTAQTQTGNDAIHTSAAPHGVTSPTTLSYSWTSHHGGRNETNMSASAENVYMSSIIVDTLQMFNSLVEKTTTGQNSLVRSEQTTDSPEVLGPMVNTTVVTEPPTSESTAMDGMAWIGPADGVASDFTETTAELPSPETPSTEMNSQSTQASTYSESPTQSADLIQWSAGSTMTTGVRQRGMSTESVTTELLQTATESTTESSQTFLESTMTTVTVESAAEGLTETSSYPTMPTDKVGWTTQGVQQSSSDPTVKLGGLTWVTQEAPQTSSEVTRIPGGDGWGIGNSSQISSEIPGTTDGATLGIQETTLTSSDIPVITEEVTLGIQETTQTFSDIPVITEEVTLGIQETTQTFSDIPVITEENILGVQEATQTFSDIPVTTEPVTLGIQETIQTSSEIPVTTEEITWGKEGGTKTSETLVTREEITLGIEETTQISVGIPVTTVEVTTQRTTRTFSEIPVTTVEVTLETEKAAQRSSETSMTAGELIWGIQDGTQTPSEISMTKGEILNQSTQTFSKPTVTTAGLRWPIEEPTQTTGVPTKPTRGPTWPVEMPTVWSAGSKEGWAKEKSTEKPAESTWTTDGPRWAMEEPIQTVALAAKATSGSNRTSASIESSSAPGGFPPITTENSYWADFMGEREIFVHSSPSYTGPGLIPRNTTPTVPSYGKTSPATPPSTTPVTTKIAAPSSTPLMRVGGVSDVKTTREASISTTSTASGNVTVSNVTVSNVASPPGTSGITASLPVTETKVTASNVTTRPSTTITATTSTNLTTFSATTNIAILPDEPEMQEVFSQRSSSKGPPQKLPEDSIVAVIKTTSWTTVGSLASSGPLNVTSPTRATIRSVGTAPKRTEANIIKTEANTDKGVQSEDPETIAKNYLPPLAEDEATQHQADADEQPQFLQILLLAAPSAVAALSLLGLASLLVCIFKHRYRRWLAARRAKRRLRQAEQRKAKKKKRSAKVHVENEKRGGKPEGSSKTHHRHQRQEEGKVTQQQTANAHTESPANAHPSNTDLAVQKVT